MGVWWVLWTYFSFSSLPEGSYLAKRSSYPSDPSWPSFLVAIIWVSGWNLWTEFLISCSHISLLILCVMKAEILFQDGGGRGGSEVVKGHGKRTYLHTDVILCSLTYLRKFGFLSQSNPVRKQRISLLPASKELYWATVNKKQLNLLKVCEIRSNLFGDLEKTSKQKSWVIDCCISTALNLKWNQPGLGPKGQSS